MTTPQANSLVLYKNRPALVKQSGDKIEIRLEDGKSLKVRPKDITLLHPGPIHHLRELTPQSGEVKTAWELLAGSTTTLPDLAELIYEVFTPATAWATWELVDDGLYFYGEPAEITARTADEVAQIQADRAAKQAREEAWLDFLERARQKQVTPDDELFLREVEAVAYGQQEKSRVLRELGIAETPESAHIWLMEVGHWDETVDPYPQRHGLSVSQPELSLPGLPDEPRRDLTHLPAFAIDDEGNTDPDDALSLDGNRLWVHIADVAALVTPHSPADIEARARGANLYVPERTIGMLPPQATQLLGLGLTDPSPALSFGLDLDEAGQVSHLEIVPSWVNVTRLSYEAVEDRLSEEPFAQLHQVAQRLHQKRWANGEIAIDLPEVKINVINDEVVIKPILPLQSRDVVREAMLAAGEAVARLAIRENIPFPFTTQDAPEPQEYDEGMAGMFARRISLSRSQLSSIPGAHAGLGLEVYAKATSPLRRYSDLIVHQQLRAFVRGESLLEQAELLERVGQAEAVEGAVRRAERMARHHWTLVYLQRHPNWQGEGILVDQRGSKGVFIIPALDLETHQHLRRDLPLNSRVELALQGINLARLESHFRLLVD